ncbi:divergent polysaccharide deacteylase family protein [Anianabacter salinae]|uniref:divergent polysaccharide deacteylase family protein n=1 Tax=Anianabacter salinae TaxID=2851023 RepID=UPI00225E096A|nr:divergent polysaccharide deacteylase family protein [Anianabacter salinae]
MKGFLFGLISGGIVAAFGLIGAVAYAPVVAIEDVSGQVPVRADVQAPDEPPVAEVAPEPPQADGAPEAMAETTPEAAPAPEPEGTVRAAPEATAEPAAGPSPEPSAEPAPDPATELAPDPAAVTPDVPQPAPELDVELPAEEVSPLVVTEVPQPAQDAAPGAAPTPSTQVAPRASALGLGAESVAMPAPPDSDPPPLLRSVDPLVPDRSAGPARSDSAPALQANAIAFENPGDAPLLSILLHDDPGRRPDAAALEALPIPVTVSINPMAEDAAVTAAMYRGAGLEIAVRSPLPDAAQPSDVEVAFGVYLSSVPEAVAVIDMDDGRLQENRPRAIQVVAILKETGHGLLTYEKGLNAGLQIAAQEGVAAATVFRAFDDGERDVASMKRFLDQGAFQAGLGGPVILEGVMRPETLQALAEWSLGQRAGNVAVAPLSAALMDSAQP